eukprot:350331-Chlamydomonas_euryale.AAC.7
MSPCCGSDAAYMPSGSPAISVTFPSLSVSSSCCSCGRKSWRENKHMQQGAFTMGSTYVTSGTIHGSQPAAHVSGYTCSPGVCMDVECCRATPHWHWPHATGSRLL